MNNQPEALKFIRLPEVCARTALSKSTVWRLERKGVFPKRHRISIHVCAWVADDVERWAREQIAARPNPANDMLDERGGPTDVHAAAAGVAAVAQTRVAEGASSARR